MRDSLGPAAGLVRLTFLVQNLYTEVSRDCGLTVSQGQLLCTLSDQTVGMAELSDVLGSERSSLTGLVDRAEQRGLVVRESDPQDRRVVKVVLTPAGSAALHRFHDELTERLEELLQELPATERDRFTKTLGRVVADAPAVFGQ